MKRFLCLFLTAWFLLGLLSGCHAADDVTGSATSGIVPATLPSAVADGVRIPTTDENYFELLCENCDMTFYLSSTGPRFLYFHLLSAVELTGKTVSVCSDLGGNVVSTMSENNMLFSFPMYVFMGYQGISWAELAQQAEDAEAAAGYAARWQGDYDLLLPTLPTLYSYVLHLPFEALGVKCQEADAMQQIRTLTVTIDGQSKTYEVGKLCFQPGETGVNASWQGGLKNQLHDASGYPVSPSADGAVEMPQWDAEVKKDVVLQSISVVDCPDMEIVECLLTVKPPEGGMYNRKWDGASPVEVDEGSRLTLQLTFRDPAMAGKLIGNTMRYISLNYVRDGEDYGAVVTVQCRISVLPHVIYAGKVDGVDMLPYYTQYQNALRGEH